LSGVVYIYIYIYKDQGGISCLSIHMEWNANLRLPPMKSHLPSNLKEKFCRSKIGVSRTAGTHKHVIPGLCIAGEEDNC
jgi:hypothetical protein